MMEKNYYWIIVLFLLIISSGIVSAQAKDVQIGGFESQARYEDYVKNYYDESLEAVAAGADFDNREKSIDTYKQDLLSKLVDNPKLVKSMSKYGELVGMAYQIRDDVLNFISTEDILKKPVKTDSLVKRPNFVLLHCVNSKSSKGIRLVQKMAEDFCERAKLEIKKLELKYELKKAMVTLADFAYQRSF